MYFYGFEAYRWVDLVEIYPLDPSNSFAFDFGQCTFAHPRWNSIAKQPALRTGDLRMRDYLCVFNVLKSVFKKGNGFTWVEIFRWE